MSWLDSLKQGDPVLVVNARFNPERKTVETVESVTRCHVVIKGSHYRKSDGLCRNWKFTRRHLEQVLTEVQA